MSQPYAVAQPRRRQYFSKWVTFSAATVLMLSAGLPYAFSVYGEPLRHSLNLTGSELSTLGAFANAGGYSAILAGLFFDLCARPSCCSPGALRRLSSSQRVVPLFQRRRDN